VLSPRGSGRLSAGSGGAAAGELLAPLPRPDSAAARAHAPVRAVEEEEEEVGGAVAAVAAPLPGSSADGGADSAQGWAAARPASLRAAPAAAVLQVGSTTTRRERNGQPVMPPVAVHGVSPTR
jgi:hypothetical protein